MDFSWFAGLLHMGLSWVCSLIITTKELQHFWNVHQTSVVLLIWTVRQHLWSVVDGTSCTLTHLRISRSFCHLLHCGVTTSENCSQKFVKWGHSLAPESLLCSLKLFEPLFLSMMQLFHLVALFSRFTFVLLSAEDAWLADFNTHFFFIRSLDSSICFFCLFFFMLIGMVCLFSNYFSTCI